MRYGRYLDPTTDFGFKKLFGEEESKPILKGFLFEILELDSPIVELDFLPSERLPRSPEERSGIFDVFCTDEQGRRFIVEMQKAQQFYFRDRMLYYSAFPIVQQGVRGDWDYQLKTVYSIGILNFTFEDDDRYIRYVGLTDLRTHDVFSEKLKFVYIELPKFQLTLDQLETGQEKWLYFLKHLADLQEEPDLFKDQPFPTAFEIAELGRLTEAEAYYYEGSLKRIRDRYAEDQTMRILSRAEGIAEGRAEGIAEGREEGKSEGSREKALDIARTLIRQQQLPVETVLQITGLTEADLQPILSASQEGK